jgi:hypothetical protein
MIYISRVLRRIKFYVCPTLIAMCDLPSTKVRSRQDESNIKIKVGELQVMKGVQQELDMINAAENLQPSGAITDVTSQSYSES